MSPYRNVRDRSPSSTYSSRHYARSPPCMRDYCESWYPPQHPPHYYEDWKYSGRQDYYYHGPQERPYEPYPRFRQAPAETVSRPPPEDVAAMPPPPQTSVSGRVARPSQTTVPTTSVPSRSPQPVPTQGLRDSAIDIPSEEDYQSDSSHDASPVPSIPSPDGVIATSDVISPSEDLAHFADQVQRMARSLGIEMSQPIEKLNDPVYDDVYCESSTPAAIPYLPVLLRTAQQSWKLPSSMPPTSRRLDNIYKIQEKTAPFLFTHPKPNSIIVEASQGRTQRRHNAPVDKEGRRLDGLGRIIYSSTALSLRVHNYQATMAKYQLFLWEKMASLSGYLPDDQRELANVFYTEASRLSRQQLNTARHATDCASKAMVASVAL